jgi:hypothetical protein
MLPGFILLAVSTFVGLAWLFVGSFLLMFRTYARPWRLMWITCLIPPLTAGFCFLVQLVLFRDRIPPLALLLPCVAVGLVLGAVRARTHEIFIQNGSVTARRSAGYLVVWAVCYGVTQLLGMSTRSLPLIKGSLLTSALSTSMLACVCIVILIRFLRLNSGRGEEVA